MSTPSTRSFFRIATAFPPPNDDYLTARQRGRRPASDASEEERRSFDGLSAYDTEAAARQIGRRYKRLGSLIVRYDIPDGAGVTWVKSGADPRHYDLHGDPDELKRYLTDDVVEV